MGFNASVLSGIVMIIVKDEKDARKANRAIKDIGYKSSFGITIERREDGR